MPYVCTCVEISLRHTHVDTYDIYTHTHNYGNFTVVNFTIILVAAIISVHRTTKDNNTVLFPHISMSPQLLYNDNLKEIVFSSYTMNQLSKNNDS